MLFLDRISGRAFGKGEVFSMSKGTGVFGVSAIRRAKVVRSRFVRHVLVWTTTSVLSIEFGGRAEVDLILASLCSELELVLNHGFLVAESW